MEAELNRITLQPVWVRVTHWINAVAVVLMMLSGWQIYDASPTFPGLEFPASITLGAWLGGALQWHFAIMWALVANFSVYAAMLFVSGRFQNRLLPITIKLLAADLSTLLRGKFSHQDLSRYNSIQKLAYLIAIVDGLVLILSGLALWKSVQFALLRTLMGGYDRSREVHFFAMGVMFIFIVVHGVMVMLVPRTLLLMIRGR